jgi:pyruvate/2-oxoglutarate dehydrogenase complex dihydrolipoamide dehydrogenase (E3) component
VRYRPATSYRSKGGFLVAAQLRPVPDRGHERVLAAAGREVTAGTSEAGFDVIVVGAGPAGEVVAGRLADHGKRVALVERHLVGGECSFYACMPSKALLRPAEALAEVGRVPGAAQAVRGPLDVDAVLRRRDEVIHDLSDDGQLPWLRDKGIELVRGRGCLDGERRVRVGERVLVARDAVVIAVGSGASMPPIPGLDEVGAWSNREITTARQAPESLIILGGGVVGVEMASAWASLGTRVTVVESLERLLAREEPVASEAVQAGLEADGVEIHLGASAVAARREGDTVRLGLENGVELGGRRLLVAIGRRPLTEGLGLESVGLPGRGYLEVDPHLRVDGHPWLYAIGDANGRSLLTHSGKYQARVAADNILGVEARVREDSGGAPRVVFTRPQVAAAGLTLEQAREAGRPAEVIDLETSATAGASFYGRGAPGTSRFVVDPERHVLLGVTFVGPEVADFLPAATIAVTAEVPLPALAHAVAAFPTRSELWLKLIEAYEALHGVTLHAEGAPRPLPGSEG